MSKRPKVSLGWRPLPSDKSINQFCADYQKETGRSKRPSVSWIKSVLAELDIDKHHNSIYNALYGSHSQKEREDSKTIPRMISWETEGLLKAIFAVKDAASSQEVITARQVLDYMMQRLADNPSDQYADMFIRYTMFENVGIQQALLRSFEPLFRNRLEALEKMLFNPEADIDIDKLKRTLEQIDVLFYEFPKENPRSRRDDIQQLNELYHELNAPRRELLKDTKQFLSKIEEYCWSTKCDNNLVTILKEQILNTSRFPEKFEVNAFLKNYSKYLEDTALSESKISEFEMAYRDLVQYFRRNSSLEQFREDITKELYTFARGIFQDLYNLDTMEISWTGYQRVHATSAYVRFVLADVHRDIQIIIHNALIPLRATYSYGFFTGFKGICTLDEINNIKTVYGIMESEKLKLSERYPNLHLEDQDQMYEIYQAHAEPIFGGDITTKDIVQQVYYNISSENTSPWQQLYAMSELLRITCQIVVAYEVEETIERLAKEYSQMVGIISM